MRAAAILGLGVSQRRLIPFQKNSNASWHLGMPASSSDADVILIFGGDGTIHRHLAQFVELRLPVLIVPCGSGNDFAGALGLRRVSDSLAAWRKFTSGGNNIQRVDLGLITWPNMKATRYFCCVAGIGLDSMVARAANSLPRWLRAHGGYAFSLPRALLHFAAIRTRITPLDSSPRADMDGIMLAAFANTSTYGHGMKIAPHALFDDGQLDICIIHQMNKAKLLALFPTIYFGRHLSVSGVSYSRVASVNLETQTPCDVYADGEYVCQTPVEVSIEPRALTVITP